MIKKAIEEATAQQNSHEAKWMTHNQCQWRQKTVDPTSNQVWKDFTSAHNLDWLLRSGLTGASVFYTLMLPSYKHSKNKTV